MRAVTARRIIARARCRRVLTASSPRPRPVSRFSRAQAFDVAQHEHRTIRFRERIDGLFEQPVKLLRVRLTLGVRLRRSDGLHELSSILVGVRRNPRQRFGLPHFPAPPERLVQRDARQPRGELRPFLELVQVRERVDVGLLHHVFDFVLVLHDRPRRAVELLVVAAHEDLEQRAFARPHALHDVRVGQRRRRRDRRGSVRSGISHTH